MFFILLSSTNRAEWVQSHQRPKRIYTLDHRKQIPCRVIPTITAQSKKPDKASYKESFRSSEEKKTNVIPVQDTLEEKDSRQASYTAEVYSLNL